MSRREKLAWIGLILLALVLRLWALGERPPHHDEAVHAHFGHQILATAGYTYDPTYHGPLLFYVMSVLFVEFGENLVTARLYPTLAGVLLVAVPFFLRRRLGSRAAWWMGLLAAISPNLLYYSRFARNDVPVCFFNAAALAAFLLVRKRGWRAVPWIGIFAALHVISKETIYVLVPLIGLACSVVALIIGVRESFRRSWAWLQRYAYSTATAILVLSTISIVAYTFFFMHPEGALFPVQAISHWWQMHKIQRVGGPWFYYLPRLALYEFLPLVAAFVWVIRRGVRLRPLEVFCLIWGVSSIAMYAYLGEKTPWLLVHQLLPFIPLAGFQLARTFSPASRWWSRSLATVGLIATGWSALASSFLYPTITTSDNHAELMVFVQTTPETHALAKRIIEIDKTHDKTHQETYTAAISGEAAWPLSWQCREARVWWDVPNGGIKPLITVCNPEMQTAASQALGPDYSMRQMPLRGWWVEEYRGVPFSKYVRWFFTRQPWSPVGAQEVLVFERLESFKNE